MFLPGAKFAKRNKSFSAHIYFSPKIVPHKDTFWHQGISWLTFSSFPPDSGRISHRASKVKEEEEEKRRKNLSGRKSEEEEEKSRVQLLSRQLRRRRRKSRNLIFYSFFLPFGNPRRVANSHSRIIKGGIFFSKKRFNNHWRPNGKWVGVGKSIPLPLSFRIRDCTSHGRNKKNCFHFGSRKLIKISTILFMWENIAPFIQRDLRSNEQNNIFRKKKNTYSFFPGIQSEVLYFRRTHAATQQSYT